MKNTNTFFFLTIIFTIIQDLIRWSEQREKVPNTPFQMLHAVSITSCENGDGSCKAHEVILQNWMGKYQSGSPPRPKSSSTDQEKKEIRGLRKGDGGGGGIEGAKPSDTVRPPMRTERRFSLSLLVVSVKRQEGAPGGLLAIRPHRIAE